MIVLLWDLDGTILDSETLAKEGTRHGFQQILGRDPTESEFAQLVGRAAPPIYRQWFGEVLGGKILEAGTQYYLKHSATLLCYAGVSEALTELNRRGYRMGIVSSKRRFAVVGELELKGLAHLFDVIVAQEDTQLHKPFPEPLLHATKHMHVSPDTCVYIGDQPSDIEAAHAAGMKSIAALWGDGKIERLESACPTLVAHHPMDILTFISQMG